VDPATAFSAINWLSVLAAVIAAFVLDMFIGPDAGTAAGFLAGLLVGLALGCYFIWHKLPFYTQVICSFPDRCRILCPFVPCHGHYSGGMVDPGNGGRIIVIFVD